MEEKIDLRVFPSPDDAPCRFVWRCLCVLHNREHNRRHIGVLGASCEQTPGMASQYGGALRWNADIRRILVYSASTRNEVKTNSVAIQCVLGTSNRAYGSRYSGSHIPFYVVALAGASYGVWAYRRTSGVRRLVRLP